MRFKVHKLGKDVATMWAEPSITVRDAHRKHCNGPAQLTAVNLPSAPGTEQCQNTCEFWLRSEKLTFKFPYPSILKRYWNQPHPCALLA